LALALLAGACARGEREGDLYRRGSWSGDQLNLRPGGSYEIQTWSLWGGSDGIERGRWSRLGSAVSLVPSSGGRARVMRLWVHDGERFLYEPQPDGSRPARASMYVRSD
jgi:hypothetical protein